MLTEIAIKNLTLPDGKTMARFADSGGLYLQVSSAGTRLWRWKYRYTGREKVLALGTHPDVPLKRAREARDDARKQLAAGLDPSAVKQARRAVATPTVAPTFQQVALEWHQQMGPTFVDGHKSRVLRLLERDIFPTLGKRPIAEITPPELLAVLRTIQEREAIDTAHRARGTCGQIFRYAVATGRATRDTAADLRGALPPVIGGHFAAIMDPDGVGKLLLVADDYATVGSSIVAAAMRLAPLVFVRPGELRRLRWADLDLVAGEWRLIVSKSKKTEDRREMLVPLSNQVRAIIEGMRPETGDSPFVFPSFRSKLRPMSEGAILAAYRRCGVTSREMTGHGWRAVARTFLDERLRFRADIIEAQLGHAVRDPNGRAYNRTSFIDERRAMMQAWADYLGELRKQALAQREARP